MELAAAALRQLKPGALYIVPAWRAPLKDFQPVTFKDRRAMLKKALCAAGLSGRPEVKISDFEDGRGRVVYTYETLAYFKKLHPGSPLYFLMGSDCLEGFKKWRRWRSILQKASLLVGRRPGYSLKRQAEVPFVALTGSFPLAASSAVRCALYLGTKTGAVAAPVLELIEKRGLYLARERRRLRKILSAPRFGHSLAVVNLALELAPGLGLSPHKAALAGLLHDCARELTGELPGLAREALAGRLPWQTAGAKHYRGAAQGAPVLLHAWAGAGLARRAFGVRDPEVLEAIALHATGAPGLGSLARLIYVCDLAAAGRGFKAAALIRRLARLDFTASFKAANYVKLSYAFAGGGWVHPLSVSLWNSLQAK